VLTLSLVVRKVSLIAISPNVCRLLIEVLEVFEAFQKQHMGSFMRQPVKQIAYKYCVNFAKTEFPYQLTLSLRCKYCKIHSRSIFPDAINSIRRFATERLQANDVSLL